MTDVTVTTSTAIVTVVTPQSATVTTSGAATATINQNQATVVSNLQQVDTIGDPTWIQFNTTGTATPAVGRLNWNETDGTFEFQMKGGNVTQQIGMEQVLLCKSSTNGGLVEGKVVYPTGSDGSNLLVAYGLANAETTSTRTLAVMTESATGGAKGYATTFGLVRGLNTDHLVEGQAVWPSPTVAGDTTATKPSAPNHAVLVGFCLRKSVNNGVLFVSISNGWELEELHNVKITNPTDGQVLKYQASTGLWINGSI